ncbi:MAG: hypothetical protein WCO55_01880 [Candidatus Falkowbacteria bacterium]
MGLPSTFENLAKIKDLTRQLAENIQQLQVVNEEKIKLWQEAMQAVGLELIDRPFMNEVDRRAGVLIKAFYKVDSDTNSSKYDWTYFNFYEEDVARVSHYNNERFAGVEAGSWQSVFEQIVDVLSKDIPEVIFQQKEAPIVSSIKIQEKGVQAISDKASEKQNRLDIIRKSVQLAGQIIFSEVRDEKFLAFVQGFENNLRQLGCAIHPLGETDKERSIEIKASWKYAPEQPEIIFEFSSYGYATVKFNILPIPTTWSEAIMQATEYVTKYKQQIAK